MFLHKYTHTLFKGFGKKIRILTSSKLHFRRNSTGNMFWTSLTCSTIIHFLILELDIASELLLRLAGQNDFMKNSKSPFPRDVLKHLENLEITELCKGYFLCSSVEVSFGYLYCVTHTRVFLLNSTTS